MHFSIESNILDSKLKTLNIIQNDRNQQIGAILKD